MTAQQSTAFDEWQRNELRKDLEKIKEKSGNAWDLKIEMSKSKNDRRNKHKVEENEMREALAKNQLVGQVRSLRGLVCVCF